MPDYPGLDGFLLRMTAETAEGVFDKDVIPTLVDIWVEDYARSVKESEIVETAVENFSYLFDIQAQRLIAAWAYQPRPPWRQT
jgi:hypothetical protein